MVLPRADVFEAPIADGGEGTLEVLAASIPDLEIHDTEVPGPRADRPPIRARWGLRRDRRLAVVELAEASGLARVAPADRDPMVTGTAGLGHLLETARSRLLRGGPEASELLLAVGGSSTVDGGIGAARALGMTVVGPGGPDQRPLGGVDLQAVSRVHLEASVLDRWEGVRLRLLADVVNPLLGPDGAARVFGPQKGADESSIERLETGLEVWARRMASLAGGPCLGAGTGAGGGGGVGLAPLLRAGSRVPGERTADLGSHLESGFEVVAEIVELRRRIRASDLVITSEGSLDRQSMMGKAVGRLVGMAEEAGIPVIAVPGTSQGLDEASAARFEVIRCLADEVGADASWREPFEALQRTTAIALRSWSPSD